MSKTHTQCVLTYRPSNTRLLKVPFFIYCFFSLQCVIFIYKFVNKTNRSELYILILYIGSQYKSLVKLHIIQIAGGVWQSFLHIASDKIDTQRWWYNVASASNTLEECTRRLSLVYFLYHCRTWWTFLWVSHNCSDSDTGLYTKHNLWSTNWTSFCPLIVWVVKSNLCVYLLRMSFA